MRRSLPTVLLLLAACAQEASPEAPPTDAGGGGDTGAGGAPTCPELSTTGDCRYLGTGGGCDPGERCTVRSRSCPDGGCCTLPYDCAARRPGAAPGGFACVEDDDCETGICVQLSSGGQCLRVCTELPDGSSCPAGLVCRVVELAPGVTAKSCVGEEEGRVNAAASGCNDDTDCLQGRRCRVENGAGLRLAKAAGVCRTDASDAQVGQLCDPTISIVNHPAEGVEALSDRCEGRGLCTEVCSDSDIPACRCDGDDAGLEACVAVRCSKPCRTNDDCPSRTLCRSYFPNDGVEDVDAPFHLCLAPDVENDAEWVCWDETDCCAGGVTRSGGPCCDIRVGLCPSFVHETTHCRFEPRGGGKWLSTCRDATTLGPPGAACTADADCESALCAPTGFCSSPCEPGVVDRCDAFLPGTQCCPMQVGDACVPSCQVACPATPACAPT